MAIDSGYNGRIVSLAGLQGRRGSGLVTTLVRGTLAPGVVRTIISANPGRVWALISNDDISDTMSIGFGEDPVSITHALLPGGSLLINTLLPWIGDIRAISGNDPNYSVTEASIQGW